MTLCSICGDTIADTKMCCNSGFTRSKGSVRHHYNVSAWHQNVPQFQLHQLLCERHFIRFWVMGDTNRDCVSATSLKEILHHHLSPECARVYAECRGSNCQQYITLYIVSHCLSSLHQNIGSHCPLSPQYHILQYKTWHLDVCSATKLLKCFLFFQFSVFVKDLFKVTRDLISEKWMLL